MQQSVVPFVYLPRFTRRHVATALFYSLVLTATLGVLGSSSLASAQCFNGTPDGDVHASEECDDGNFSTGDGCDNQCLIESGFVCKAPIDFTGGVSTEEYYSGSTAVWTMLDRYSATQGTNTTNPTIGLVGTEAKGVTYVIDIEVQTTSDDDFIGFVLGFNPGDTSNASADYLFVDWKQANQNIGGGTALAGLALNHVTGIPSGPNDFWLHGDGIGIDVDEIARGATLSATGWSDNTVHTFAITYTDVLLDISVDGVTQFSGAPGDFGLSSFPDGQIGFYGFSQEAVNYTVITPRASVCNEIPTVTASDVEVWTATTGPNAYFDVDIISLANPSDPDMDGLAEPAVASQPVNATVVDPLGGAPSGYVRITPNDDTVAADYVFDVDLCDNDPDVVGCATVQVTVHYNDDPTIGVQSDAVLPTTSATILLDDIKNDAGSSQGTVSQGWDDSSFTVATTENGSYSTSVASALGGTCAIDINGDFEYTAPGSSFEGQNDSCWVQLCEAVPGPTGAPSADRACGKAEFTFLVAECLTDVQCDATAPVCSSNACTGCSANADCSAYSSLLACNTNSGECVECNTTEDSLCTGLSACNPTTFMCEGDADGDGVADSLDADRDNDGTPNSVEGTADSDGDGITDDYDLDSDNDGIPDLIENGGSSLDVDQDGRIDGADQPGFDADGDGLAAVVDVDDGDSGNTTSTLPVADTDNDTTPDVLDLDSDADGVFDVVEAGGTDVGAGLIANPITDANGDGWHDPTQNDPLSLPDWDENDIPNFQDNDDDGDGVPTADELGSGGAASPRNTDGDGMPDYRDTDDDGDGLTTADELGAGGASDPLDSDGDNTPDYLDADDDGDGIPTVDELGAGGASNPQDSDGDGTPDYLDTDDDGDGVPTADELGSGGAANPRDSDGDGTPDYLDTDDDGDGMPTSAELGSGGAANPQDSDGDGTPDYLDSDDDGDGVPSSDEYGPGGAADPQDTDGDGTPDYLDTDDDGDSVPTSEEIGNGSSPRDSDGDGIPDYLDTDDDNDGVLTIIEASLDNSDIDGDGLANWLDVDSDGDGILDGNEALDLNGDGIPDFATAGGVGGGAACAIGARDTDTFASRSMLFVLLGAVLFWRRRRYS
ncbi:MAG: hypothetical protein IPJ88_05610 [Myxococcales bacterium]|nr:MAG: hypothetical protein IPJ88_05610 [Myxococcales bacterium]